MDPDGAEQYLKALGFQQRDDRTWRPPTGLKKLSQYAREALDVLVISGRTPGLLTDRQWEQRRKNLETQDG